MFKKIGIVALLVAAGVFAWKKTDAGSYINTFWGRCKEKATTQVPIEFEIDRLRGEVAKLIPDLKKNLGTLAQEMVAVENLREEIATTKTNLEQQKTKLRAMKEALETNVTPIAFNGRTFTANRLREMLVSDLTACQRCEEALKHKEQLLEAKEKSLDVAREQLATIKVQKQELEVQLAQLEAELRTLRVAQTRSKIQLDDSRLARIKQSISEIRSRMKVEQTHDGLINDFVGELNIGEKKPVRNDEVIRDVEAYLNGTPKTENRVATQR